MGPKTAYTASVVLRATVIAPVHLGGHFCSQIKFVDKKQVQTEDNGWLRIWRRWSKPAPWDISNKTPTQFCGGRTAALLANAASGSCFITSFGILSIISSSSRFWHSATARGGGRCPRHLGSTGCPRRLHALNSAGVQEGEQWDSRKEALPLLFLQSCFSSLNNTVFGDLSW